MASNFFVGEGVQMLISIETHITCDSPGGPDPLSPPLDPHMVSLSDNYLTTCVNYQVSILLHGYAIMGYCVQ